MHRFYFNPLQRLSLLLGLAVLLSACQPGTVTASTPTIQPSLEATDRPTSPPPTATRELAVTATTAVQIIPIDQYPQQIGAEASVEFIDQIKNSRPWQAFDGSPAPIDADGWPTGDAFTVVYDERPCCVFFEPPQNTIDDPVAFQRDISGTYHLRFRGQATIRGYEDASAFTVVDQIYDAASDITSAKIIQHPGKQLMILAFSETDGGVREVQLLPPGYDFETYDPARPFTPQTYRLLAPYAALRFMGLLETNSNGGINDIQAADNTIEWAERHLPTDATQQPYGPKFGLAWEYIIHLANELHKDIWIPIPSAASEDYVRQLAILLRDGNGFTGGVGLSPDLKIYIEDSNEVWNGIFPQHTYMRSLARTEIIQDPQSMLNQPSSIAPEIWTLRLHARRTRLIGQIFGEVFGPESVPGHIRPVLSWWVLQSGQYLDALKWLDSQYGPPVDYLYAIAGTGYFALGEGSMGEIPVDALINNFCGSARVLGNSTETLSGMAAQYSLGYLAYEGGPASDYGFNNINMSNRARAMRDPRLADVITYALAEKWFPNGGGLFMYFTALGRNTRFGYWGTTEDANLLFTPQLAALHGLGLPRQDNLGGGLRAEFFNNDDLSGDPIVTRVDVIDFDWGRFSPAWEGLVDPEGFSARWTGLLAAPETGEYILSLDVTGGARLTLNSETAIDAWELASDTTLESGMLNLEAGQFYPITLEFRDQPGDAAIRLKWQSPGQIAQIIPRGALYPTTQLDYTYNPQTCK